MKRLEIIGHTISATLPYKLRRKLNLIYQRGKYANIAVMARELLEEATDRRILQMNPKVSEKLNKKEESKIVDSYY